MLHSLLFRIDYWYSPIGLYDTFNTIHMEIIMNNNIGRLGNPLRLQSLRLKAIFIDSGGGKFVFPMGKS